MFERVKSRSAPLLLPFWLTWKSRESFRSDDISGSLDSSVLKGLWTGPESSSARPSAICKSRWVASSAVVMVSPHPCGQSTYFSVESSSTGNGDGDGLVVSNAGVSKVCGGGAPPSGWQYSMCCSTKVASWSEKGQNGHDGVM